MEDAALDPGPCLTAIRSGDEEAARALVTRLHPLVMSIVRANLPRRMGEEDLAQEVFARLFERLHLYEARAGIPFEHWASRVAVRTCLDALRAERRRPEVRCADLPDGGEAWLEFLVAGGPEPAGVGAAEAREIVELLLAGLSPEDRLVIRLLDLEERTPAQVAAITGWSTVGVRVRAFRARTRLRRRAAEAREEGIL